MSKNKCKIILAMRGDATYIRYMNETFEQLLESGKLRVEFGGFNSTHARVFPVTEEVRERYFGSAKYITFLKSRFVGIAVKNYS